MSADPERWITPEEYLRFDNASDEKYEYIDGKIYLRGVEQRGLNMSALPKRGMTAEEYLRFDSSSDEKYEYVEGEIYAMTGGSPEHNAVSATVIMLLGIQLRKRPCIVYTADQRIKVSARSYYYPDITVVCGTPMFEMMGGVETLINPTVVIEVLSPSTEQTDRWTKAVRYRALPSVQDYLFIAQDKMGVELHSRNNNDVWTLHVATEANAIIEIPSIDCTLTLADIYEKIILPTPQDDLDAK